MQKAAQLIRHPAPRREILYYNYDNHMQTPAHKMIDLRISNHGHVRTEYEHENGPLQNYNVKFSARC